MAGPFSSQPLDYESEQQYVFTIRATDDDNRVRKSINFPSYSPMSYNSEMKMMQNERTFYFK